MRVNEEVVQNLLAVGCVGCCAAGTSDLAEENESHHRRHVGVEGCNDDDEPDHLVSLEGLRVVLLLLFIVNE